MDHQTEDEADVTVESALKNAARLLHHAELETDLAKMERIEELAGSWAQIATILVAREQGD